MSYLTVDEYDRIYLDSSSNRLRDIDGTPIFYIDELYEDMGLTISDDSRIISIEEGVEITEQDLIQMIRDNVTDIDTLFALFDKMQSVINRLKRHMGKLDSKVDQTREEAEIAKAEADRANKRLDELDARANHWFSKWRSRWFGR